MKGEKVMNGNSRLDIRRTVKSRLPRRGERYKKDLHDPDNHDGVITHIEPDILECEVKWVLGSITMKKLVGVMKFHLSYFKS